MAAVSGRALIAPKPMLWLGGSSPGWVGSGVTLGLDGV